MIHESGVFRLNHVTDDPRYPGFHSSVFPLLFTDVLPTVARRKLPGWRVKRVSRKWVAPIVSGKVRSNNDFPSVNLVDHAFSGKGVDALRDLLESNGELLPVRSPRGTFFLYNLTTVADVLNVRQSKIDWSERPFAASFIRQHVFSRPALKRLTIFRIPQLPTAIYLTETFVNRVVECGLQGMVIRKVWPLPPLAAGSTWLAMPPVDLRLGR